MPAILARIWPPESFCSFSSAATLDARVAAASTAIIAPRFFIVTSARDLATHLQPRARCRAAAWATRRRRCLIARSSALRACRLVEGGAQPLGELHCVVIGLEVTGEQSRLLVAPVGGH